MTDQHLHQSAVRLDDSKALPIMPWVLQSVKSGHGLCRDHRRLILRRPGSPPVSLVSLCLCGEGVASLSLLPTDYTYLPPIKLINLQYVYSGFTLTHHQNCCSTLCGTSQAKVCLLVTFCLLLLCCILLTHFSLCSRTITHLPSSLLHWPVCLPFNLPTPTTLCHPPRLHSACPHVPHPAMSLISSPPGHFSSLFIHTPFPFCCSELITFQPLLFCFSSFFYNTLTVNINAQCLIFVTRGLSKQTMKGKDVVLWHSGGIIWFVYFIVKHPPLQMKIYLTD